MDARHGGREGDGHPGGYQDPVTQPIDFTNKRPTNIQLHFGKVSKLSYNKGTALSASGEAYTFINPGQSLPRIISSRVLARPVLRQ